MRFRQKNICPAVAGQIGSEMAVQVALAFVPPVFASLAGKGAGPSF